MYIEYCIVQHYKSTEGPLSSDHLIGGNPAVSLCVCLPPPCPLVTLSLIGDPGPGDLGTAINHQILSLSPQRKLVVIAGGGYWCSWWWKWSDL